MNNKFKELLSSIILTATPLLASNEGVFSDNDFVILENAQENKAISLIAPDQFTAEQYKELREQNFTTEGAYTLTVVDPAHFRSLQPSAFRVLTSQDASVTQRISKTHSEIDISTTPPTLIMTYAFSGAYLKTSSDFLVRSNVPIHGDEHITTSGPVAYRDILKAFPGEKSENLFQLMYLVDEQFIGEAKGKCENRLNHNAKNLLLIIAQQEGENISALSSAARDARASELYYTLLSKVGLTLKNDQDSLGIPTYKRLFDGLVRRVFYNAGIDPSELPDLNALFLDMSLRQAECGLSYNTQGIKHLVPLKAILNPIIHKDISTLHVAPLNRKGLRDQGLVQLERAYQAQGLALSEEAFTRLSLKTQQHAFWSRRFSRVIDFLEREAVAQFTGFLSTNMQAHMPYGTVTCNALLALSQKLGRSRVADLLVDIAHGVIKPKDILEKGIFSDEGLKLMNKGAECLISLMPGGGMVYAGGEVIVKIAGFESPVHMARAQRTLPSDDRAAFKDKAIDAAAEMLRQGVKKGMPAGPLFVEAAAKLAKKLEARSLTHYVHKRLTSSSGDPAQDALAQKD